MMVLKSMISHSHIIKGPKLFWVLEVTEAGLSLVKYIFPLLGAVNLGTAVYILCKD